MGDAMRTLSHSYDGSSSRNCQEPVTKSHLRHFRTSRPLVLACCIGIAVSLASIEIPARAAQAAPSSWSISASPNPVGNYNDYLNSVSCMSTSFCMAVGYFNTGKAYRTLAESWNGSAWSIVASPNETTSNDLKAVSCSSATSCMAVGYYSEASGLQQGLIESWNGSVWSIDSSPNPGGANILWSVSCPDSKSCMAAGYYASQGSEAVFEQTLIESWNGTVWSVTPSPDQGEQTPLITTCKGYRVTARRTAWPWVTTTPFHRESCNL